MTTINTLPRKKQKTIKCADFWCGSGGSSTGLRNAVLKMGGKLELVACNHWITALNTHQANHTDAKHYCEEIENLDPLKIVPGRYLDLLIGSPACTHHSKAKGGKPRDEQSRADAWLIKRWVEQLYIKSIFLENVPDFLSWGPLKKDGTPDKRYKGLYFKQFIDFLEINYTVEWRILNCADYGDPTTRERFFLIAKRGKNKKIEFPEPTHASRKVLAKKQGDMFAKNELKPWIPARDIINWELPGKNVFGRKKPLSEKTMQRTYAGARKYSGIDIPERKVYQVKSLFSLLSAKERKETKTTGLYARDFQKQIAKQPFAIFPDFELEVKGKNGKITEHNQFPSKELLEKMRVEKQAQADEIYRTSPIKIDLSKINPFLLNMKGTDRRMRSIDEPTFTQTASSTGQYVVEPYLMALSKSLNFELMNGAGKAGQLTIKPRTNEKGVYELRPSNLNEPSTTIVHPFLTAINKTQDCSFIVKFNNNEDAKDINEPLPTITTREKCALGQPFFIQFYGERDGQIPRPRSIDEPFFTITPQLRLGIIEPFLVKLEDLQNGVEYHGLLLLELGCLLVINLRMMDVSELKKAMSFPDDYILTGTKTQKVKQLGNAVPVRMSEAISLCALAP